MPLRFDRTTTRRRFVQFLAASPLLTSVRAPALAQSTSGPPRPPGPTVVQVDDENLSRCAFPCRRRYRWAPQCQKPDEAPRSNVKVVLLDGDAWPHPSHYLALIDEAALRLHENSQNLECAFRAEPICRRTARSHAPDRGIA